MSNSEINTQSALEQLLLENLKENRLKRRWGIFFKLFFILYLIIFALLLLIPSIKYSAKFMRPHTSVVDIDGEISADSVNDADTIVRALNKAFKDPNTRGIILRINSPGGSPVQASYIYSNIMFLRKNYPDIKIYAVCSDSCASAAYYIASATDDIYADPASLVGSIGVLMDGFGFNDAIGKLGISRRLLTAGSEKGMLDPFSPLKPEDKAYVQKMLDIVHQQFIAAVEHGRGNRLDTKDPLLFSGLIWTGAQAKSLGLIDGFGSAREVARNIIKYPNMVNYTPEQNLFSRLSKKVGENFANGVLSTWLGSKIN